MINFDHFELNNGLKVYVHQDRNSLTTAFNLCYNVGSRDESPDKTGFAHLFEHLMFGGSENIPEFDTALQKVGGNNNAFTSLDITNYYITLPYQNLETAFWLESDRMKSLSFQQKVLDVQKGVVTEEFKQRYLNQPYGDLWLKLRPLIYQQHPYSWPTIGKDISHIEKANMEDVKDFFFMFYRPNNAVLAVAGNVNTSEVERLAKKWFGDISPGQVISKDFMMDPAQTEEQTLIHHAEVPLKRIYKAYRAPRKNTREQFASSIFANILGRGQTSVLYNKLVKEEKMFSSVSASNNAYIDESIFIISAVLNPEISEEEANQRIEACLEETIQNKDLQNLMEKVKTQAVSLEKFGETEVLNRAMKIAIAANDGDVNLCNEAIEILGSISYEEMIETVSRFLKKDNCNTMFYLPKEN